MQTVGIIGLGVMGLGIAQVFAQAGFRVLGTDAFAGVTARGRMVEALAARKLSEEERAAALGRFEVVDLAAFAACDLVIEAIVERVEAKRALIAELEGVVSAGAVIATNTSSLGVGVLAAGARHPERILALHFFNPATAMKLVELAPHSATSAEAVDIARGVCEAAGKTVIACADRPGFIVNRCARPYYGEALALLEEGVAASRIDAAMMAAGYRLGPFGLIDLIGADINLAATQGLAAAMGLHPRYHVFAALQRHVASGNLGRKSGRGFLFPDRVEPVANPAIVLRIEAVLVNEAAWLLSEGGVGADGIDTAMRLGLNFPRGPFEALGQHGKPAILAMLEALERAAPPHLSGRYLPAPGLA